MVLKESKIGLYSLHLLMSVGDWTFQTLPKITYKPLSRIGAERQNEYA